MDGDHELLHRWRHGDRRAGNALIDRYYQSVERFFINKVNDGIADLVQDTFARCLAGCDRLADDRKFRQFLFGIARNVLLHYLRDRYRNGHEIDITEVSSYSVAPGPRTLFVRHREQRLLLEGLRRIPFQLQIILELHYWEDLTTAEMADVLGVPEGTAKSRLQRARARLEQVMSDLTGAPELLKTTLARLDDWARECRDAMERHDHEEDKGKS
jgi:RNA polymerase sigma-70 factor (ECF subfamily)